MGWPTSQIQRREPKHTLAPSWRHAPPLGQSSHVSTVVGLLSNPTPRLSRIAVLISLPASRFLSFSSSNYLLPHHTSSRQETQSPAHQKGPEEKNIKRPHSFFSTPFLPFDFCFSRNKSQRILLVFLSCFSYGRLYEKILSRQQKSQTWTLKPASRSPSASSHPPTGTAKRRPPPPRLTKS